MNRKQLFISGGEGVKAWDDQEKVFRPILAKDSLLKEVE